MGRKPKNPPPALGQRLRDLRKARGFTQVELAAAIDSSQRMIAYYEAEGGNVSADVISKLAEVLDVSIDEIVHGPAKKKARSVTPPQNLRLMRKLRLVETLPAKDRRSVLHFIDSLLEKEALKRA